MKNLKEKLAEEIKSAMKSGQKEKLSFARNLHSAIRKKEIDERVDLDDAEVEKIVLTLVKQRQDSIEQFKLGKREDLVEKEKAEWAFLQNFLPPPMSAAEGEQWIDWAIAEANPSSLKEIGAVMKLLLPKIQGRIEGKWASQRVKEEIEKKLQKNNG